MNESGFLTLSKKVELLPYKARKPLAYEFMTEDEILNKKGSDLIFDTECFKNFFLIAFMHVESQKVIEFIPPFNERKLSWLLHSYRCIGFNSFKYDIPLVWASYKNQNTEWLKKVSNSLISGEWFQEVCKEYEIQIFKTPHTDLLEVCPLRGSLKLYSARLHAPRIQELPIEHTKILTEEEKTIINNYCINDLYSTKLLFTELKEQLDLRTNLSREYTIDVMSKSDAQIAESVIGTELKKITGKWPAKPKKFDNEFTYQCPQFISFQTPQLQHTLKTVLAANLSVYETGVLNRSELDHISVTVGENVYRLGSGGLHSSEKNVSCQSNEQFEIIDKDVASYYPAIVLALGLYPEHIGPDFLNVYKSIVERRLYAKKNKNIAISECLKITINGTFGKTGSPYSILYAPQMMIQITLTGQLALLMLIEDLEINNIPIYSANTDGIVIKCPRDKKDLMNAITQKWEKTTGFQTEETKYKAIYSRDVNCYIAIKENGDAKGKNLYYDPWRGKTAKDLYWRFQKNPVAQICIEAIENEIIRNIPYQKTIRECQDITKFIAVRNVKGGAHYKAEYLGKVIRYYWAKNVIGGFHYIESNNLVPDTEGALPLMDLPDELPLDINYEWYIARTREMLMEMDYIKRPKQLKFF